VESLVRAAVVGLGWAGTVHARTLAALPGIDLVALADPDPQRRAAFPHLPTRATVDEVLALGVDYCVVATPTSTHERIAVHLAEAGVPALVEKPLAPTAEAAWRIADAFGRRQLTASVGHTERHNPVTAQLARLLTRGDFGPVWQIALRRQGPFPDRITDVGVALDLAVHDLDLAAWLAGQPIEQISATTSCLSSRHEDTATATAYLRSGLLAHLHIDRISPFKDRTVQVHTPSGVLTADAVTGALTLHPNTAALSVGGGFTGVGLGEARRLPVPAGPAPFHREHELMRDALLGLAAPGLVTLNQGASAVAAAEALLTSACQGQRVAVRYPHPART